MCIRLGFFLGNLRAEKQDIIETRLFEYAAPKRNPIVYLSAYDILSLRLGCCAASVTRNSSWYDEMVDEPTPTRAPRWFAEMRYVC
jgi:hypothetical protein